MGVIQKRLGLPLLAMPVALWLLLAPAARVGPAPAAAAEVKGTLTVAYATLFDENLNPLFSSAPPKVYYDVMYEYLVYNDPQTWKAEPGLAERWSMSQDGKRWVFFLRKGVTFPDGAELTAEDVKFSMDLLTRKDARWPLRATFLRAEAKVLDRHTVAFDSKGEGGLADLDLTFSYFLGMPIVSKVHYDKVGDKGSAPSGRCTARIWSSADSRAPPSTAASPTRSRSPSGGSPTTRRAISDSGRIR